MQRGELWPDDGGADLPSFPDSFDDHFEKPLLNVMEQLYSTNSLTVYRTFLQMFDNVSVLDIHEDRTFENLICSFPDADTACAKVSLMNVEKMNAGSEYTELIMFDLIVLAARTAGLIDPKLTRAFIRDEVQKHVKTLNPNYRLPLKCLSPVQERELCRLSAKLAGVMPGNISVDSSFAAAISANTFCGPDTEKILADKNWADFFHTLGKNQIVDVENGISNIKIENATSPNGISKIMIKNAASLNGISKIKIKNATSSTGISKINIKNSAVENGTSNVKIENATSPN
jgi:hypothetical protein